MTKSPLDKCIYTGWFDTWLGKWLSKKHIRKSLVESVLAKSVVGAQALRSSLKIPSGRCSQGYTSMLYLP